VIIVMSHQATDAQVDAVVENGGAAEHTQCPRDGLDS